MRARKKKIHFVFFPQLVRGVITVLLCVAGVITQTHTINMYPHTLHRSCLTEDLKALIVNTDRDIN